MFAPVLSELGELKQELRKEVGELKQGQQNLKAELRRELGRVLETAFR